MANEKRLIDADALKREMYLISHLSGNENICIDCIVDAIDDAPTVDAVEAVRCKDCKSRVFDNVAGETWCNNERGLCARICDTDFCSYGERRDDET